MKFGTSSTDITPAYPVELAGYGYYLGRMSHGVERYNSLRAGALALEDGEKRAVLCGVDLLSVDDFTVRAVQAAVDRLFPDQQTTVLINASHTHSGPASRLVNGAGGYNSKYVKETLVPSLTAVITDAFGNLSEGEIGLARQSVGTVSYNQTGDQAFDDRATLIRVNTPRQKTHILHYACHPVVYGRNSHLLSADYPGFARDLYSIHTGSDSPLWLTGSSANIKPTARKELGNRTTRQDAVRMGGAIAAVASELYGSIQTGTGALRAGSINVDLPIDRDYELNPNIEVELFREVYKLPKDADLSPVRYWFEQIAPTINAVTDKTTSVPVTGIAVGNIAFLGVGAEIFSATGTSIEKSQPEMEVVTMMNSNEHNGYIPPIGEYLANHEKGTYATRFSAPIFSRKPLAPSSEEILVKEASRLLDQLARS